MSTTNQNKSKTTPVQKIRVGSVTIAFWENKTSDGIEFLNATIKRSYKDAEGNWKDSDSYAKNDLNSLAIAVQLAQVYANVTYPQSKKQDE